MTLDEFKNDVLNGKPRCEREPYIQPLLEREQEACDKFEKKEK